MPQDYVPSSSKWSHATFFCFRELIFWWLQLQLQLLFIIPSRIDSREMQQLLGQPSDYSYISEFQKELILHTLTTTFLPFESKLLPAVLLLLRIYFPKITVTVTVLKFGWISITVTVFASAVTPSFHWFPITVLKVIWINFPKMTVTVTVL